MVALPTAAPPNTLGNVVLLTSNHRLEIPEEMLGHPKHYLHDDYMHWYILQLNHALDNRFVPDTDDILVLTDDLNPVDLLGGVIILTARKQLHSYLGENGLNW